MPSEAQDRADLAGRPADPRQAAPLVHGEGDGLDTKGRRRRGLRDVLEAGPHSAERQAALVVMRGRRGEPDSRTIRLADQSDVILRVPGDRDAWSIPPAELAALGRRVQERSPDASRDDVKRQVGRLLGWGRHTAALDALLESALGDLG